jgi:hypothetical protein
MLESDYQAKLIKKLERLFPGCVILKNDSGYLAGFPDLTILYRDRWAVLEVKPYEDAPEQPNQDYYVERLHKMSFSAFIYPENEEAVLNGIQRAFERRRSARVSFSE